MALDGVESDVCQRSLTPGTGETVRVPALTSHGLDHSALDEVATGYTAGREQQVEVLLAVLAVVELREKN